MGVSFVQLRTRLEAMAPVRDGRPANYDALVLAALEQLTADVPMIRQVELAIVSGTAVYALPADFAMLIALEGGPAAASGVLVTDVLTVVGEAYAERLFVEGLTLRIAPTPGYSAVRTLRYGARYVLDEGGVYPLMSLNGARIALLYGAYLAQLEQAAGAGGGWKYQIGDEMVDKSRQAEGLLALANNSLQQYRLAVSGMKGYGGTWAPASVGSAYADLF